MEETVEPVVSSVVDVAGRAEVPKLGNLALAGAVGLVGGATVAWFVAKRHYKSVYETLAEQEIAEAKEFYARYHKVGEYSTPEGAVSASGIAAAEALTRYQGGNPEPEETVVVEERTEATNVFVSRQANDEWDQDAEDQLRTTIGDNDPYIISKDEFMANENDYQNPSLAYFAEDDVLVDEQEKPIEQIEMVVGEDNLTKFGHGSGDNRVVYIRNDKLGCDFEIIKNDGSYSKEVLGFQHSDGPKVRKFRDR